MAFIAICYGINSYSRVLQSSFMQPINELVNKSMNQDSNHQPLANQVNTLLTELSFLDLNDMYSHFLKLLTLN